MSGSVRQLHCERLYPRRVCDYNARFDTNFLRIELHRESQPEYWDLLSEDHEEKRKQES
jgi:hypothetical protein